MKPIPANILRPTKLGWSVSASRKRCASPSSEAMYSLRVWQMVWNMVVGVNQLWHYLASSVATVHSIA